MNTSSPRLTLLACLLLIQFTLTARAQDLDTVPINGRIQDQNAAAIPAAEIQATLVKTTSTRKTKSDAEGRYRLIQLEPGIYVLGISSAGFASQHMTTVANVAGQSLQLDIPLYPAAVEVEAAAVVSGQTKTRTTG